MNNGDIPRSPRDADQRALIRTELDRNLMVLAGAGAGKTHELLGRMVALVRAGRVTVDQVAAITFTRKAAGELRERLAVRLSEALFDAEGVERTRLQAALRDVDQCFIGTIHSFCGCILRERPIEANVPPDFTEIQGEEEKRLARKAWDGFFRGLYGNGDPRLEELEEAGIEPDDLWSFFRRRNEIPELDLRFEEVLPPDLPGAAHRVVAFAREVQSRIPPFLPEGRDGMMRLIDEILAAAVNRGIDTNVDAVALLERLPSEKSARRQVTLTKWDTAKVYAKDLRDVLYPSFLTDVVEPALRQWREHLYAPAAQIVEGAVAHYRALRQSEGLLTFNDLLFFAANTLRRHPEVRAFLQRRFRVILVDEFQDTDPVQAEVLMYLTGADLDEKEWRQLVPRPGSLFLVGDEKQSIYRFRRADVAIFRFMRDRIVATGGRVVHLNTSFRSLGNLCRWLNKAFSGAFRSHDRQYQAEHGELFEYREPGAEALCVRKLPIQAVYRHSSRRIVGVEAPRIARFIRSAIEGKTVFNGVGQGAILDSRARPGDFLILTRTNAQLSRYAAELEAVGVPFDITGSDGLRSADEVGALVDLLSVLHEPDNPVHFVALLRGLLFGFSDSELYTYRRAGGRFLGGSPVPVSLPDSLKMRIQAANDLVESASRLMMERTPSAAIERLIEALGLTQAAATRPLGSSRAGNLLRLLSFVRSLEVRGKHWGEIVSELGAVVKENAYDLEEMTLDHGSADAVRIMNIHQAKGLQAKVVLLADPFSSHDGAHVPDSHVKRTGENPHLSVLIQRRDGERGRKILAQPVGWADDADQERRHEAGEATRLIYVAATRAKNLLIVSTYPAGTDSGHRYRDLYEPLADVPVLEEPDHDPDHAGPVSECDDLSALLSRHEERIAAICAPTYTGGTVSGSEDDADFSLRTAGGRGRDFGSLIHRVFENAVGRRIPADLRSYLESECESSGFSSSDATSVGKMLDALRRSPIWGEVESAQEVYTEVPLAVRVDDAVIHGKIDLIYRVNGGWKIVDYKTDLDASSGQLPLHMTRYVEQVRAYAAHWEAVTGERVVAGGLYGTSGNGGYVSIL